MHKYEELEKLYYKKKYKKIFTIIITSLFFIVGIGYLFNINNNSSKTNIKKEKIEKNVSKYTKNIKKIDNNIEKNITKKIEKKDKIKRKVNTIKVVKKLILYPVFPDISDLEHNKTSKIKDKEVKKIKQLEKNITKKVEKKQNIEKKDRIQIKIIVKSRLDSLKEAIKLYNNAPEYNLAIKIANSYFDNKDYENSIQWAKKANKLKPEDRESWYIFAKGLLKQNKPKQAKKVLMAYLDNYGADKKIEKLLRSIK